VTATASVAGIAAMAAVLALLVPDGRPPPRRAAAPRPERPAGRSSPRLTERLGRVVARWLRLPVDEPAARQMGRATGAAVVVLAVSPPAAVALVGLAWVRGARRCLRLRAEARRAVERSLPDAVDLLLLCTTGGMSLALSHPAVADRLAGPVGHALVEADRRAAAGTPRGDALVAALDLLGDRAGALGRVLADHLRYGVPLGPSLDRLGLELRIDRRRRAEEAARKVPVRLLGPLVACTLPAFALLTVVPLLAASLQRLPT
jgi:Flp pilus assembly protein TadB